MTKLNWREEITLAVELAYEAHPYPKDYQYRGDEYKRDEVIKDVTDQILAALKAHIASYPTPENPYEYVEPKLIFTRGAKADRKALMESLE